MIPRLPKRSHLHRLAAILLGTSFFLAGCGVPSPDGPADSFGLDFAMGQDAEVEGALVFYIDGLNAGIFEEMLTAGQLPAIKKYLADRGMYVPRAVANTPSVTLANLTSFVTGLFPGHHGVTGINWFDRNSLIWRNYETIAQKNTLDGDYIAENIYEQFPDRTTFSVFFQPHRGTTKFIENWTSAGPPFFFGWYEFVDRLTLHRLGIVADVARQRQRWPAVTIAYMLSPDFRAYGKGVESDDYRQAILHTDRQIGRVCGDLASAGILDKLHLVLVSDHSLMEVTNHFPLDEFLRDDLGLDMAAKRLWDKTPFEERLAYYRQFPAVTYGSGDRYWAICLRSQERGEGDKPLGYRPWTLRPSVDDLTDYVASPQNSARLDLIEELLAQQAVDAVAFAVGPDRVQVARREGKAEFYQQGGPGADLSYHLVEGEDPFGWTGHVPDGLLDGNPASCRKWLEATTETQFPDLPSQVIAYFRARRAGDLAVFASPGWDFKDQNRAGHGGLRPGDMHVPLLIAGPGITPRRINTARSVDVMPTILDLLGRQIPDGLDGQTLVSGR